MSGGVLEIHGKPKMSWTKLTKTANKMSENNGLHVQHKVYIKKLPWDPHTNDIKLIMGLELV